MAGVFGGRLGRLAQVALGVGVAAFGVQSSLFDVPVGHRALLYDHYRGIRPTVYNEGGASVRARRHRRRS
jgi:hypothetical protein